MKKNIAHWIATCGPVGEIKFAPGSFGSLLAVPLILLTANQLPAYCVLLSALIIVGIWSSSVAARDLGLQDPSNVVIDEVCGMMMSFLFISTSWRVVITGFCAFRLFDIAKPPPVRLFERFPSGFGIVLDDLAAGLYANLLLHLLIRYAHL